MMREPSLLALAAAIAAAGCGMAWVLRVERQRKLALKVPPRRSSAASLSEEKSEYELVLMDSPHAFIFMHRRVLRDDVPVRLANEICTDEYARYARQQRQLDPRVLFQHFSCKKSVQDFIEPKSKVQILNLKS